MGNVDKTIEIMCKWIQEWLETKMVFYGMGRSGKDGRGIGWIGVCQGIVAVPCKAIKYIKFTVNSLYGFSVGR